MIFMIMKIILPVIARIDRKTGSFIRCVSFFLSVMNSPRAPAAIASTEKPKKLKSNAIAETATAGILNFLSILLIPFPENVLCIGFVIVIKNVFKVFFVYVEQI